MQILYDAAHWITAACVDGEVYVANSLGNNYDIKIFTNYCQAAEAVVCHLLVCGYYDVKCFPL